MSSQFHPYSNRPVVPSGASTAIDARRADQIRALTEHGIFDLLPHEKWWRDHYHILVAHGYRLRYRYFPGRTPSWSGVNISPYVCDDAYHSRVSLGSR